MGDFADAAADIADAFDTDLAEAVRAIDYRPVEGDATATRGVPGTPDAREIDGEAVQVTSTRWLVLRHELAVEPDVDDVLIVAGRTHRVARVSADPAGIAWLIFTNA